MPPTGGGEVFENLRPVGQVHKRAPVLVLEIAVAKLDEPRVLVAAGPARGFLAPVGALPEADSLGRSSPSRTENQPAS